MTKKSKLIGAGLIAGVGLFLVFGSGGKSTAPTQMGSASPGSTSTPKPLHKIKEFELGITHFDATPVPPPLPQNKGLPLFLGEGNPLPGNALPSQKKGSGPTRAPSPSLSSTVRPTLETTTAVEDTVEDPPAQAPRATPQPAPQEDSHMLGGVKSNPGFLTPEDFGELAITSIATPTTTPTPFQRVGGQARGYSMLYLMQPNARQTVEAQVTNMINADIRDLYLGVLVDGTFSIDFDYLDAVIQRLNQNGRSLTLALYFTNGATMRKFETTPITVGFNFISPDDFRTLIRLEPEIQKEYQSIVARARGSFNLNFSLSPNNHNIAIVMLEDNLLVDSYQSMKNLASGVLGTNVEFVRNPCPGCWSGNDVDALGGGVEYHAPNPITGLGSKDGYTLDGAGYAFPTEAGSTELAYSNVQALITQATQQKLRYFGLWRAERQGLGGGKDQIDPAQRTYEVPTAEQSQLEIELLRQGLDPVTSKIK